MKLFAVRLLAAVTVALSTAGAVNFDWNGSANTAWLTPGNWTPAGPPTGGAGDFAQFTVPGANQPTISATVPDVEGILTGPGGIVITQTASVVNQTGTMRMGGLPGAGNVGTLNISGGTLQALSHRFTETAGQTAAINVSGTGILRQSNVASVANATLFPKIGLNGAATVSLSGGTMSFDSRVVAGEGTGTANITQTGGTFEVRRGEFFFLDGTYNLSGGTLRTMGVAPATGVGGYRVTQAAGETATINVSGNGILRQENVTTPTDPLTFSKLGLNGTATVSLGGTGQMSFDSRVIVGEGTGTGNFTQTGGTFDVRRGELYFFRGTYDLSGGTLQARSFRLAEDAGQVATINVSAGTMRQPNVVVTDASQWALLGGNGTANVNLSGTGVISFDSHVVAGASAGLATVTQTGGTFEVRRGEFVLGDSYTNFSPTPTANYNISAGTLSATSAPNPTDETGGNITVAQWGNANSRLTVSGTGNVRANRDLLIADVDPRPLGTGADASNRGEIVQTGGTVTFGRQFIAGRLRSGVNFGDGIYTMSGGTLMQDTVDPLNVLNHNHIGMGGTGTFTISDGTASFNARTLLGSIAGGIGTVTQSGGLFEVRSEGLFIGDLGTGTYNISDGTVQTLGTQPINVGNSTGSNGTLNVSANARVITGGNLNVGNSGTNPRGTVTQSGGTVIVSGNLALANVAGNGTYNLNSGTLDLTGGDITHGPGVFAFFFTGGRLRDAANINLPLTQQGGVLAPGPDPGIGTTTINDIYSLNAAGTLEMNIEVADFDKLIATGTVTLAGSLDLFPGSGLANGQTFLILANNSASAIIGTFAGRPDDAQFVEDGLIWSIDYQGGDGNDVLLTYVVPEPGSTGLIIAGLLCGALRRRRRPSE